MKKKTSAQRISQNKDKENHSINEKALKTMPSEPLPQPKDYDEIEY